MTSKEADNFNRWSLFPAACIIQLPCGALNAWSMWQTPLSTNLGVVAPAAADWTLEAVATTFPWLGVGWGLCMACCGPWIDRAGPRYATIVGATFFGGGHLLSALGCYTGMVQFVWLGWGLVVGMGTGLCYTAPMTALLSWFPDKKGLATGLAVAPYALGGMFAAPLIESLRAFFFKPPIYAGAVSDVEMKLESGRQLVKYNGEWREAVLASADDFLKLPADAASRLTEGVYLVGTGDCGAFLTFTTLAVTFFSMMSLGGSFLRLPPPGWAPQGWTPPVVTSDASLTKGSVSASTALRLPQFWLLWFTVAGNASAGVLVIPAAKVMMGDIFASIYPAIATAGFSTAYVSALSVGNSAGRIGWPALSDHIGRKNATFACSLALPACLLCPQIIWLAVDGGYGTTPLYMFCGTTMLIVSWYGGSLALLPSYTSYLFGPGELAAIYGRLMTGWSSVAILSPSMLNALRGHDTRQAINSLAAITPPEEFERAFQAPITDLDALVEAKAVTIARLMEIAPPGTVDPSPFVYNSTFYAVSGVIALSAVTNALITKVDAKHFSIDTDAARKPVAPVLQAEPGAKIDGTPEDPIVQKDAAEEKSEGVERMK